MQDTHVKLQDIKLKNAYVELLDFKINSVMLVSKLAATKTPQMNGN